MDGSVDPHPPLRMGGKCPATTPVSPKLSMVPNPED